MSTISPGSEVEGRSRGNTVKYGVSQGHRGGPSLLSSRQLPFSLCEPETTGQDEAASI